jgi:hypothetical protein
MTEPLLPAPDLYTVSYSQFVRDGLLDLLARARTAGRGKEFVEAARQINARLKIYPQFGEPLFDLPHTSGQIWLGSIGPLAIRYALYENRRLVMVAVPFMSLGGFG